MPDRGCFGVLGTLVRTVWLVLLVWSVVVVGAARPLLVPVAQSTDLDLRAVDRCVDAHLERVGLPGAVIVITRGNEPLYVHGYGHDSRGNPMTDTTPVPIASLSKSFTALAVMQLVDDGRVDLDVPVVRYLPEFMMADPRSTRITVRQLLDHTSGMADASFPEKSLPAPSSLQESVASLREASLSADPGTKFQYHNPNYWVAARLVEVVSGERFPDYLQRHVFGPAGMVDSVDVGSLEEAPQVAAGYIQAYGITVARPEPAWYLEGGSGVVTTGRDLAHWLIVHTNGGRSATGRRLVSAGSLLEMHDGMGWRKRTAHGQTSYSHNGWMFTYTAYQTLVGDYGIAVISNKGLSLAPDDSSIIVADLVSLIEGRPCEPGMPWNYVIDLVLALLTLASAALGVRALRRARDWSSRRGGGPRWRTVLVLGRHLVPPGALVLLPTLIQWLFRRDIGWAQLVTASLPLVIWIGVSAAFSLGILTLRLYHLLGSRAPEAAQCSAQP